MEVKGLTPEQIHAAVDAVNVMYDGQLGLRNRWVLTDNGHANATVVPASRRPNHMRFTLKVHDSKNKPGARRSMGGRRMASACWHLNRDLYVEMFRINPDAEIHTMLTTYRGFMDFIDQYPLTGSYNVGCEAHPLRIMDACNCHEFETYDRETTILYRTIDLEIT
jgi:hypothetical protein